MGRYSDSDDDRPKRKKHKRRSRSRSSSSSSSYSSRRKKVKKSKSKHRKRSRSDSSERSHRPSRRRHSRSRSRDRQRHKRRSRSRGRRSRSREYRSRRSSVSSSRDSPSIRKNSSQLETSTIPGFNNMNPSEQSEAKLQLALKAAAAADEKLKEIGVLDQQVLSNKLLTASEQQQRIRAIEDIEGTSFSSSAFVSSRNQKAAAASKGPVSIDLTHDEAIFSRASDGDICSKIDANHPASATTTTTTTSHDKEPEGLMHSNLYQSGGQKMERWLRKLATMRRKKLEGQVMG